MTGRARVCVCVGEHNPDPQSLDQHHVWPTGMGGPDVAGNKITLCPNTHRNVHELLRAYVAFRGNVPGEIKVHFSPFARRLAVVGYSRWVEAGRPKVAFLEVEGLLARRAGTTGGTT